MSEKGEEAREERPRERGHEKGRVKRPTRRLRYYRLLLQAKGIVWVYGGCFSCSSILLLLLSLSLTLQPLDLPGDCRWSREPIRTLRCSCRPIRSAVKELLWCNTTTSSPPLGKTGLSLYWPSSRVTKGEKSYDNSICFILTPKFPRERGTNAACRTKGNQHRVRHIP
jgi:hypothetical protein